MKKIFRMALVFALAGATLMYTGCTKDYDEDITATNKKVEDLAANHAKDIADLNSAISNLQSAIESAKSSITEAYKAADTQLSNDIAANKLAIEALEAKLADYATKVALADSCADLRADLKKVAEGLETEINGVSTALETAKGELTGAIATAKSEAIAEAVRLIGVAKGELLEALAVLGNELRSIVPVPELYVEGVEATSYGWTTLKFKDMVKAADVVKVDNSVVRTWGEFFAHEAMLRFAEPEFEFASFPKDAQYEFKTKAEKDWKTLGHEEEALYDLNPSSFNTDDADWALSGHSVKFVNVVRADDAKVWTPEFVDINPVEKSNDFAVKYIVKNPELLRDDYLDKKLPTMELVATLGDDEGKKDITSSDLVIYPYYEEFKALGFDSKLEDVYTYNDLTCDIASELYSKAAYAVYFKASLACDYRETLDLNKLVKVHMIVDREEVEYTLADLQKVYPKLDMTFELVDYTVGESETNQSMYGAISKDNIYSPMTVKGGKQVPVSEAENSGIAAVDKKPLVLVKLKNGEDIVLAGYFKIVNVKKVNVETIELGNYGPIPYVCAEQTFTTTYDQFSEIFVDHFGDTYQNFVSNYKVATASGYSALNAGGRYTCKVFVKNADGEYVEVEADKNFGTIVYNVDNRGAVNDYFKWTLSWAAIQNIEAGKSKTVYVQFYDEKNYSKFYVSFEVAVAAKASFDFGANRVASMWFDDVNGEAYNTFKVNVPVNDATSGANVANFDKEMNVLFEDGSPVTVLSSASPAVYSDKDGKPIIAGNVVYVFAEAQKPEAILGYTLKKKDNATLAAYEGTTYKADVATISGDKIKFVNNDIAKKILNSGEMVYANVQANISYGPKGSQDFCVETDPAKFHALFIKPLFIEWGAQTINEESQTDGANVYVKKFFKSIVDWNSQNVIDVLDKDGKEVYKDHIEKDLNMFTYYQFGKITVDLANATRDNANTEDLTKKVKCSSVGDVLQLGTVDATTGQFAPSGSNEVVFHGSFDGALADVAINYKNNSVNQKEFKVWVPATISYFWGTFETTFEITIKNTTETQPL